MKKILISSIAFLGLGILSTGCLKDKGFDNHEYGYQQIENTNAVAMAQANSRKSNAVKAIDEPQGAYNFYITYEGPTMAPADISGTIVIDNTILDQYAGVTPLPAGTYDIDQTFTILQGQRADTLDVFIENASGLDPNLVYGVGVRLNSVDDGYNIPANLRNIAFTFTIKNRYDAIYDLTIMTRGWAAYGISENTPLVYPPDDDGNTIGLFTTAANKVSMFNYYWGDALQPGFTDAGGPTAFGAAWPEFEFDLATDRLINVVNLLPDDGRGRAFAMNPAVTDSRFDPATRTIYAAYILKQNGRPDMQIFDTLTFHAETP